MDRQTNTETDRHIKRQTDVRLVQFRCRRVLVWRPSSYHDGTPRATEPSASSPPPPTRSSEPVSLHPQFTFYSVWQMNISNCYHYKTTNVHYYNYASHDQAVDRLTGSKFVPGDLDLWPWHSNSFERGTKHVFHVNLEQICSAVAKIFHTQTKKQNSHKQH